MPFSLTTCGDDGVLDYYLLLGSPADILAGYTALTGRAPVPPAWPFGWWQSRCLYASAEEVLRVVREMRDAGIPMDVIHLDTNWFAVDWRCDLELAPDRFPWPQPARRVARNWIRLRYRPPAGLPARRHLDRLVDPGTAAGPALAAAQPRPGHHAAVPAGGRGGPDGPVVQWAGERPTDPLTVLELRP